MLGSIFSFFAGLFSVVNDAISFFSRRSAVREGEGIQLQSGMTKDLSVSEKERQADVDAPKTAEDLEALLDKGEA